MQRTDQSTRENVRLHGQVVVVWTERNLRGSASKIQDSEISICRLPVEDVFQAMDEISRVMAPGGILLQFTEEPPEVRLDLWERWGRTVNRKVKIGNEEVDDKYVYRVTFS